MSKPIRERMQESWNQPHLRIFSQSLWRKADTDLRVPIEPIRVPLYFAIKEPDADWPPVL